jgi:hypothetical protein
MKQKLMLLTLFVLVLSLPVLAQWPDENHIRMHAVSTFDYGLCTYGYVGDVITMQIQLLYPVNPDFGPDGTWEQVQNVGGFEMKLYTEGEIIILEKRFPVDAIDVGEGAEMIVGFGQPLPVVDTGDEYLANLAEVDVLLLPPPPGGAGGGDKASPVGCSPVDALLHIEPIYFPSIEGQLAYLDYDDPVDPLCPAWLMSPIYGDPPVAYYYTILVVDTEKESWDAVKALYR